MKKEKEEKKEDKVEERKEEDREDERKEEEATEKKERVEKEKEEEKEEEEEDKKKEEHRKLSGKQNKQTKFFIILMVALIFVIILVSWVLTESKKFEYGGLEFKRIMFDKLPLYHAKIPIVDEYGNLVNYFNFYLREDPRKLSDIEIRGRVILTSNSIVAADPGLDDCNHLVLAGATFGAFLRDAGVKVEPGSLNKTHAKENELAYTDCQNPEKTSIMWMNGNKTEIVRIGNCYIMSVANCEIINATERMMMAIQAHGRGVEI